MPNEIRMTNDQAQSSWSRISNAVESVGVADRVRNGDGHGDRLNADICQRLPIAARQGRTKLHGVSLARVRDELELDLVSGQSRLINLQRRIDRESKSFVRACAGIIGNLDR